MFQRIKGAIDQTIAQEQARQRLPQSSPSRSGPKPSQASSRNISPGKRQAQHASRGRSEADDIAKGPDPSAFEPEFIVDDEVPSRAGTPRPSPDLGASWAKDNASQAAAPGEALKTQSDIIRVDSPGRSSDLPADVRVKIRKLDKLESKYHELLRSYRIAHGRVQAIETFEASLREHTPLTSIGDPNALVEYLNQINLKGDMVLDELKRVSNERDDFRRKLGEAEQQTKEAWDEVSCLRKTETSHSFEERNSHAVDSEKNDQGLEDKDSARKTANVTTGAIQSLDAPLAQAAVPLSRQAPQIPPTINQDDHGSQDLFSYDGEIPRLESEIQIKQGAIDDLSQEVLSLKNDLAVTRESTQSMVQTLEEATREVNTLRDGKDRSEAEIQECRNSMSQLSEQLREKLQDSEAQSASLQAKRSSFDADRVESLTEQLREAQKALATAQQDAKDSDSSKAARVKELEETVSTLRGELAEAESCNDDLKRELEKTTKLLGESQRSIEGVASSPEAAHKPLPATQQVGKPKDGAIALQTLTSNTVGSQDQVSVSKKKNKKKKKNGKAVIDSELRGSSETQGDAPSSTGHQSLTGTNKSDEYEMLRNEIEELRDTVNEKESTIERLSDKLKDQDGLHEEIETLRDDLLHVGEEHVATKDKAKDLLAVKATLERRITEQEEEIVRLQSQASSNGDLRQQHDGLATQFEALKGKAAVLQSDLAATEKLASARFKDLNELRTALQKAQPEINKLRSEAAEIKSIKETLGKREAEYKRLDARHEDIRSEVIGLKQAISNKDSEVRALTQKVKEEHAGRLKMEDAGSEAREELQRTQTETRQASDSLDRLSKELTKSREELISTKTSLRDAEQQLQQYKSDSAGLREDIELKSAQYASAQSLMASMRDQTSEMATQMKETKERCESLDEEVAEAHRLLSERSREGETMRRLLADVEGRADARTREMKERMDTALEERDRAEDEASTASRRRARELEDLRNKLRDIERSLKRSEDDREELESSQRDWKRRRDELEQRSIQSHGQAEEARQAMMDLRDALDANEKQVREQEKQKTEMRRTIEETQHKLERLQKTNKSMADELIKIQNSRAKAADSEIASSRSSSDSTARLSSPKPRNSKSSSLAVDGIHTPRPTVNGQAAGPVDYVYLKNVLLQFLEQKDKKLQVQLVPVLGMLLHFDRNEEQKWMSVINTKA